MLHIPFEVHTLSNGLRIIIHPDRSIPKAVINVIYRVGAKDEDEHRTGFAHLFEHLMFEGSQHIPSYDTPLQRVGGQNNAFTTSDITNYYLSIPSNQLETGFWLESDRMLGLNFSQEKLDIQKSVVIEEFKQRYLNQPYGNAHLELRKLHYEVHPYHWATIGKEISHIAEATLEEVKDFFYGYYAPNNATLVVAGDVDVDQVLSLAEKWFGPIPTRNLKKQTLAQEPVQTEAKQIEYRGEVPFEAVYKMFHIPAHTDKAYYTADMITDILANGKSSLLHQHMTLEKEVSPNASAFSWGLHDPGIISIDGQVAAGKSIAEYETALQEVFDQLMEIDEDNLQRMKTKLSASFVIQKTRLLNKAIELAMSDVLGDPDLINKTPEIYQSITLKELKTAAAEILAPSNSSTLYYLPQATA